MKPIMAVLQGKKPKIAPIWLMRQAGRYLPEYRKLRAEKGGFLDLVYDSDAAAEVTLQPIRRFNFDGAILFSDILVIPQALGQDLWFETGEGPRLAPQLKNGGFDKLIPNPDILNPVYDTIKKTKAALPDHVTMLGFAGSPWTVATYMVNGQGSKDQYETRLLAYKDEENFTKIIDAIVGMTIDYLCKQIDAGVEAVQLFDSWAGSLSPAQFDKWVIRPNTAIVKGVKAVHPNTPIIGFPKGAGGKLAAYAQQTGVDAIGLDETVDPIWANNILPKGMPVQGNLDPLLLMNAGDDMVQQISIILKAFENRPHIFNLGHGIGQFTPIENVEKLLHLVRDNDL
ncbi:uroporphyrinogen decarboxylase [Sphingorhabdus lutea]|uniref:Uroporphyrinogen decarboxylase n=1 Tax=Sphingorhabdus lutea TaxID=1913578 RepID=A0A1L3J9F9_9SPHN|nr:uroporphyrinogen decarboxylase [Sphingorhabdus lutea]APG61755.1 uroporphyrinogen decarboxylase [Sphingorhabdus lutea]